VTATLVRPVELTLRQRRCLFTRLLTSDLMPWAYIQSAIPSSPLYRCEFALDEGTVKSPRLVRKMGMVFEAIDAVHGKRGTIRSRHHEGQAIDILLYRQGLYITNGSDLAYRALGARWLSLHYLCAWGGDFSDANHFSLRDGEFE
jgi:hypothetical protein